MDACSRGDDPQFFALVQPDTGKAEGVASYLRITPAVGVIEVGHISYAPRLQRTAAAANRARGSRWVDPDGCVWFRLS
jgi:hypothetical protein